MIFDGQREVRGTGTGKKRNQVSVYGEQYREKGVLHRNTWRDCSCQELSRVSIFFFFTKQNCPNNSDHVGAHTHAGRWRGGIRDRDHPTSTAPLPSLTWWVCGGTTNDLGENTEVMA